MTLIHRRITYLAFMAVFFIVLPLIILEANGYKFNFKKSVLQKTGIIFVESKPKDVLVWLDGKLAEEQTPAIIKDLLPNEYQLKLSKEGYQDWEKKINVRQAETNVIQYVRLFRENSMPQLLLPGNILEIVYGNSANKMILLMENNEGGFVVEMYSLADGSLNQVWTGDERPQKIKLIDSEQKIVVETAKNLEIVDALKGETVFDALSDIGLAGASQIKVDEFSGDVVYYLAQGKLRQLNLFNGQLVSLPYEMTDYMPHGSDIYFLSNATLNKTWLKKTNLLNSGQAENLVGLDAEGDYAIVLSSQGKIMIRDNSQDELLVWDERQSDEEDKLEIIGGADYFSWNEHYDELLFGNDWELWSYRVGDETNQYVLFTRLSETISEAAWYRPGTHIIYVAGKKLKVVENLSSNRQSIDLAEMEVIRDVGVNKKGDKIYFIGQAGAQAGLYELVIQ